MNMNQNGFANIILVIVVVMLLGAVGYFAFVKKSPEVAQQTNTPTPTQTKTLASTPTSTASETSTQEVFKNQPGAIRSLAVSGNNQWMFSVDLLSYNPHWLPGVDSTGRFFINQDPKIRNLTVTKNTKAYDCGGPDGNGVKPGLLVDTSSFISQIQADINTGNYTVKKGQYGGPVRYLDITGSNITAMYQQCLP
jgi:hypothetical protein